MAIVKGAMTYTRFRVTCSNTYTPEEIEEKQNLFRFKPLDMRADDTETEGFCPLESEYDDEKRIAVKDFYFDGKIALSLRIDTLRIPKQLLRTLVRKSIAAYQREHKRLPDRSVKKEIELAESKALRTRILPSTKIVSGIWCPKSRELRIFSRSISVLDRFIELFERCFMIKPERRDFPAEAFSYSETLHQSIPSNFSHQPIYVPPMRTEIN